MNLTIPQAYRNLYRAALRATLYSSPARFIIRNRLRSAFRAPPNKQKHPFDPLRINRTLLFLRSAAESPNLERRVVRNLVRGLGRARKVGDPESADKVVEGQC